MIKPSICTPYVPLTFHLTGCSVQIVRQTDLDYSDIIGSLPIVGQTDLDYSDIIGSLPIVCQTDLEYSDSIGSLCSDKHEFVQRKCPHCN